MLVFYVTSSCGIIRLLLQVYTEFMKYLLASVRYFIQLLSKRSVSHNETKKTKHAEAYKAFSICFTFLSLPENKRILTQSATHYINSQILSLHSTYYFQLFFLFNGKAYVAVCAIQFRSSFFAH